jgi:hypothetical protein
MPHCILRAHRHFAFEHANLSAPPPRRQRTRSAMAPATTLPRGAASASWLSPTARGTAACERPWSGRGAPRRSRGRPRQRQGTRARGSQRDTGPPRPQRPRAGCGPVPHDAPNSLLIPLPQWTAQTPALRSTLIPPQPGSRLTPSPGTSVSLVLGRGSSAFGPHPGLARRLIANPCTRWPGSGSPGASQPLPDPRQSTAATPPPRPPGSRPSWSAASSRGSRRAPPTEPSCQTAPS